MVLKKKEKNLVDFLVIYVVINVAAFLVRVTEHDEFESALRTEFQMRGSKSVSRGIFRSKINSFETSENLEVRRKTVKFLATMKIDTHTPGPGSGR